MQYIRERLSLNLSTSQQTEVTAGLANGSANGPDTTYTPPKPPTRKVRDGHKLSEVIVSPTISTISESISQHGSMESRSRSVDASGSTYVTPFQSPVVSERWSPHSTAAEKSPTSIDKVHFQSHNQYVGYPSRYSTPIAGGYVNHSFIDATGSNATDLNRTSHQAQVIHEHYWTWSCRCRRQFTNREKVLLLVICFLLLIIGGLSAYLGLSDSGNPLPGGLLTPGVLQLKTEERA
ncbi:AAEL003667-PA [Aedes aegypti]|uniref:AAEL003667-PA n=2 Tax=Aedes aegypti TaxID=7159 RepID=Q17EU0_AEDAE|nr:AAEL003667-PB [Aedes aegypti]EAT45012.1 AAEL003667-PA [Aedes aegypti]